MAWTATNPVSIGDDTKYSHWTTLWANSDFINIPSGTVMLFAQSSPPTGWTKYTSWANNSMLIYTTGNISQGGSDNPKSWASTTIAFGNESTHTHGLADHTHNFIAGTKIDETGYMGLQVDLTTQGPSVANTGAGTVHTHGVTQATFTPNYVEVIAATKDVGAWTAADPVTGANEAMKQNAHWSVLWANSDFNYIPTGTLMIFGQSSAPTGWTKKTDWTDDSMLIYTTGAVSQGGSDNPISWVTDVAVQNEAAHTHSLSNHTHQIDTGDADAVGIDPPIFGAYHLISGVPVPNTSGTGTAHNHGVNQDTFSPRYSKIIVATKDSGSWEDTDPVAIGYPTKKNQYDTLWDNIVFNYFAPNTVMLFGQNSAPTGWTKKTDWTNDSMLTYTIGNISQGGSDTPTSWTTNISLQNESSHTHNQAHNHTFAVAFFVEDGNDYSDTLGGPSTLHTTSGTAHTHAVTAQDTMWLRYQSVIAATKDT